MFYPLFAILALVPAVTAISSSNSTCTPETIQTRIEWTNMETADKHSYLKAAQFLPFHRLYLHVYEQLLRAECGYEGPTPWWDETRDAGNFKASPLLDPDTGFGGDGTGPDGCVTDGPFANTTLHVGPGQRTQDHCLSRKVSDFNSTLGNETYVQQCHEKTTFLDFWQESGFTTHGAGHSGIGGVMEDIDASPGDPCKRLYQLGGSSTQEPVDGKVEETTLDYVMTTYGIHPNATVRDVMDIQGGFLCYQYDY
ncbi:hypothetical protein Micbo1qcDRAFT_185635 [Microdochium bolleyi]|uniref:Tyrosinase copper-binding domain-containing protein n=1 Tax=Microdochium bolleyi TaxID=196109 RepID=A0A136IQY2_9PEZI|nr:hypothetical protein Micbo1qcDRAFT_185635 [Microdochium bolleyi]